MDWNRFRIWRRQGLSREGGARRQKSGEAPERPQASAARIRPFPDAVQARSPPRIHPAVLIGVVG